MEPLSETEEEITANKELFAERFMRDPSRNAFAVALTIYSDTSKALRVSHCWPTDPLVVQIMKQMEDDEGEMAFVASKAEQAKLAWKMATNEDWPSADRIKALELTGKLTGAIERPVAPIQNNNVTVNRVMIVKDHGSNDDWEAAARKQQKSLINADYTAVKKPN